MTTDRELLELAAKAAGIDAAWLCLADEIDEHAGHLAETEGMWLKGARGPSNSAYWNPVADDGDALRLAIVLHIGIRSHGPNHWQLPSRSVAIWSVGDHGGRVEVAHGDGQEAKATRRAIVRAAVSIWEATQ